MTETNFSLEQSILKNHQLHVTLNRVSVLHYLLNQEQAVDKVKIEKYFNHIDTVTIYRMLISFVKKGILHTITNDKGEILYAICKDNCTSQQHIHNHIHFSCKVCEKTFCLENIHIPGVALPKGYISHNMEMHITGICNHCHKKKIKIK